MPSLVARRRFLIAAVIGIAGLAIGGWYVFRPAPAAPPAVDLSHADPEVAAAVENAIDAVKSDPRDAATWGKLGMVLRAHDFGAESVQALREAERLDPTDPRWPYLQGLTLLLARPEEGIACLRRAAERSPANRPESRLRLAEVLLEQGRIDEAEATAKPIDAMNSRAALLGARIAAARGDWTDVSTRLETLRDEPSCRKQSAMLRGQALARLGRTDEAERELKTAAQLPDDPAWDDPFVREVERLRVGSAAVLAQAGRMVSEGQANDAIPLLERVVQQTPEAIEPRLLLGQAYQLAGDSRASQKILSELTRLRPDSVDGWFHLGVAQFSLKDFDGAAKSFTTVVRLKPDHAIGYFNLAHALRKKGDRSGAITALEEALRCRPDHEPSRQLLNEIKAER